jgi:hypothetical protein
VAGGIKILILTINNMKTCKCKGEGCPKCVTDFKNKHHCWCKFDRDNVGKMVIAITPSGYKSFKHKIKSPNCGICNNTGWCY